MYPASDGIEFLAFLWGRRVIIAIACLSALAITAAVSFLLTPRYTATASVLIEPPGGNDPRAATAVSPVYLESLKTYEHLASSDSLFSRALDDLHLRAEFPHVTVESLKRQILSVNKPTSTTIIQISATLDDARQAQALAQYMAEHTVELNAQLDEESNREMAKEPQRILADAVARRERAEKARDQFLKSPPLESREKQEYAEFDVDAELKAARASEESARTKFNDVLASAPFRGIRLRVLDPGIVPQRPSFPNTPLNLIVALGASFIGVIGFLALRFAWNRMYVPWDRPHPVAQEGQAKARPTAKSA
jgi:capsular polysaccharide biosynthesis protein